MPSASEINSETCTPLVRLVADFNKEDADKDPLLTIARLGNYIPAFRSFLTNRSAALQQEVYRSGRTIVTEFQGQTRSSSTTTLCQYKELVIDRRGKFWASNISGGEKHKKRGLSLPLRLLLHPRHLQFNRRKGQRLLRALHQQRGRLPLAGAPLYRLTVDLVNRIILHHQWSS